MWELQTVLIVIWAFLDRRKMGRCVDSRTLNRLSNPFHGFLKRFGDFDWISLTVLNAPDDLIANSGTSSGETRTVISKLFQTNCAVADRLTILERACSALLERRVNVRKENRKLYSLARTVFSIASRTAHTHHQVYEACVQISTFSLAAHITVCYLSQLWHATRSRMCRERKWIFHTDNNGCDANKWKTGAEPRRPNPLFV